MKSEDDDSPDAASGLHRRGTGEGSASAMERMVRLRHATELHEVPEAHEPGEGEAGSEPR